MPVKIRYTPQGTRYASDEDLTPLEELEAYKAMQPKNGSVLYRPHPRGLRSSTAAANPAASSGSPQAAAAAASPEGRPQGKGPR
jgi:hypothetical protein